MVCDRADKEQALPLWRHVVPCIDLLKRRENTYPSLYPENLSWFRVLWVTRWQLAYLFTLLPSLPAILGTTLTVINGWA
ncbi:hypothetical protein M413DRAFT_230611 [Hebeloma cylindrosporum]|uniref:Uncharacterized protein n=1 Tax=Hebeloma cylindrosporum TaxID=76867 RepID=A0A0C3CW67_HEBCY|nr:hypothetical protein M413DRAFT_230611 [Hebeloma cylindrosporum h7]